VREDVPVNSVAMMGATFLVGLFSDPAIEKLREVFQVLFRTAGTQRTNPLAGRKPTIEAVNFAAARPGAVLVEGSNFAASDNVAINGAELPVVAGRTDKHLEVQLPAPLPAAGTSLRIIVVPTQTNADASNIFATKTP
jgi:hypothetical protein